MGAAVPKVLLPVQTDVAGGKGEICVLRKTVSVFSQDSRCRTIVVCVPVDWQARFEEETQGLTGVHIVHGGQTRQESVRNGVEYLAKTLEFPEHDPVLVHDAARCCVSSQLIERILSGVKDHGAVTAAVRIVDSLCRGEAGAIERYVDRESLWAIQTPQAFTLQDLLSAHRKAAEQGIVALDDAALVARHRPIHFVDGERFNIKVTEPADLVMASNILACGG